MGRFIHAVFSIMTGGDEPEDTMDLLMATGISLIMVFFVGMVWWGLTDAHGWFWGTVYEVGGLMFIYGAWQSAARLMAERDKEDV